MFSAIIVAGGTSRRMGFDKLMAPVGGFPVIAHSARTFLALEECSETVIVCRAERREEFLNVIQKGITPSASSKLRFAEAGAERQDSVASGLAALASASGVVAVHDAARPLASESLIRKVIAAAMQTGGATAAHPVTDTLKRADTAMRVTDFVDRNNLWAMETPQAFDIAMLREAMDKAIGAGQRLTDDVSAFNFIGRPVSVVHNTEWNPKITFPGDMILVEALHGSRQIAGGGGHYE